MKYFWTRLLKFRGFRTRILAHIKADYFHELNHSIPLNGGYWASLLENDSYDSFSEIFIQQEYKTFLPDGDITKVLDIGAHYGYFSLWLQAQKPSVKLYSTLVEPSSKCRKSLMHLVANQILENRFVFLDSAVGSTSKSTIEFFDRPHMGGSIFPTDSTQPFENIITLKASDILESMAPPYDLIKCDIEGAEWEFLTGYSKVISESRYLLLEWHSWHSGGNGYQQIKDKIEDIDFRILKTSKATKAVGRKGKVGLVLAENQNFLD